MASKNILLFFLTLSILSSFRARRVSKTSCGSSAAFYRIAKDHILNEEPISRNITTDLEECVDLCIEEPKCKAMNTHKRNDAKMDCHLLKDDHMSKPKKVIAKQGWSIYDTGSKEISRRVGSRCLLMNINPCPSHCTCVDTCDSYRCDCYGPEIFQSCREALREYPGSNLYYWIQQEGLSTAVYAKCVKETDGSYYALIDHDSESRRKVDGYDAKASYIRQFKYLTNAFEDIVEFVNASSSCRQHTKLECYNMRIIYQNWGYIMDRDGKKLNYLGGGPSNGVGCACGISGTCRDNAFKCNCDANLAGVWLKDEGYVMDKNVLPLTEIRLGDTGASTEVGYHTIGKLECTEHFNSCKDALQDYPSGGLYHWIKHKGMENAVKVKCIKKSDGKIWAQFDHDTENRAYISGFEACHSYKKEFKYGKVNTMTDIIAFIETSSSCKQFTKAECKGIQFISRNCAYLQGRNGKQLSYFGGGPANGVGCKCGIDGACINAAYKCNCDSNSGLTSDEGYVRKKEDLPLNGIALGDTGASAEYAYHTIGKLECLE